MKKVVAILLMVMMMAALCACASKPEQPEVSEEPEVVETPAPDPEKVTETDYMTVEGIYVDESYVDEDKAALKMVYLIYTVQTNAENLSVSSTGLEMTVGGLNAYTFEH